MRKNKERDEPEGTEELEAAYANNTLLEPSVWDLKIFFGQWYNKSGVEWHTAVVLPWAQVKLLSHYLRVNLAVYEAQSGKVMIPPSMSPQPLPQPPEGGTLEERQMAEMVQQLHREVFGSPQQSDSLEPE